ncbi:MAG: hypothetical protein FH753_18565 [Firmicutes bacterium]|nr:hypothetical protein [Bacillota bacterium]
MNKHNIDEFLKELSQLSKKYDIYIGGCGCCGSPYIQDKEKYIAEFLKWNITTNNYEVEIIDNK